MIKNKVKVIKNISIEEQALLINSIVDAHFDEDETGKLEYSPLFVEVSKVVNFIGHFVNGVTFEENESMYDAIVNDKQLMRIYRKSNKYFKEILGKVEDIVEYKKAKLIHTSPLDELLGEITKIVKETNESLNLKDIATLLPELAKLGKGFNQKEMVAQVLKSMPKDHKKPTKTKEEKVESLASAEE